MDLQTIKNGDEQVRQFFYLIIELDFFVQLATRKKTNMVTVDFNMLIALQMSGNLTRIASKLIQSPTEASKMFLVWSTTGSYVFMGTLFCLLPSLSFASSVSQSSCRLGKCCLLQFMFSPSIL